MRLFQFFCCGGKANLLSIFLLNLRIFFLYIGIGIRRGWTTDRKLHVDTLIFIPTWKINVFHIPDNFLVNTLLLYSRSPYSQTERQTETQIHSLCLDWRNFFPVVLLCQVFVLAGNRCRFYIHTTYVLRVLYSCGVVLVLLVLVGNSVWCYVRT